MKTESLSKLLKAFKKITPVLPSVKMNGLSSPKVGDSPKLPGLAAQSKKNPVKVIEQIKNKDIKDQKMKEAQSNLKINKSTGQWSLDKSEQSEIDKGTKEEREHLGTLKQIAEDAKSNKLKPMDHYLKNIAKEHISKIKDYYSRLERMESEVNKVESLSMSTSGQWSLNKIDPIKVSTGSNIVYAGKSKDGAHKYHLKLNNGSVKVAHVQAADIGGSKKTFIKENSDLSNNEKKLILDHHSKNIKD